VKEGAAEERVLVPTKDEELGIDKVGKEDEGEESQEEAAGELAAFAPDEGGELVERSVGHERILRGLEKVGGKRADTIGSGDGPPGRRDQQRQGRKADLPGGDGAEVAAVERAGIVGGIKPGGAGREAIGAVGSMGEREAAPIEGERRREGEGVAVYGDASGAEGDGRAAQGGDGLEHRREAVRAGASGLGSMLAVEGGGGSRKTHQDDRACPHASGREEEVKAARHRRRGIDPEKRDA
jgi:hypothetical protein